MKALVTGHLGFIGSHVYEHLLSHGHEVDGYDIPYDTNTSVPSCKLHESCSHQHEAPVLTDQFAIKKF